MSYTLDCIPEDTTHVWLPALNKSWGWGTEELAFYRKTYYKKNGKRLWKVYSRHTGWRLTQNDSSWFDDEKAHGRMLTVRQAIIAAAIAKETP